MGMYLNPGNSAFAITVESDYVDKTGLISLINKTINKKHNLTCISRPRRFGKSYAAQMLCAYYDHTCDSHSLFDGYEISKDENYTTHMNQYQVIYLDMTNLLGKTKPEKLVQFIEESVEEEILAFYPNIKKGKSFDQTLLNTVETTNTKFIMIIDEWDAPIRETPKISEEYLNFLRMLFKSSGTTDKIFAAAYMTGILPIKKTKGQSAVSNFREYSVLNPGKFAKYTGFTENEVRQLCEQKGISFEETKKWYDGYSLGSETSIYNPYSVTEAMDSHQFQSYWQKTSVSENLEILISINKDGLQEDILKLIAGEELPVYTKGFNNDFEKFRTKDDVLTLLIHLGYLSYHADTGRVCIPNEEIRFEFNELLRTTDQTQLVALIKASEQLLADTFAGNGDAVAEAIEKVRATNYAPAHYNNEQSLRYAVKFAYIICVDRYMKVEELASGKGLADVVYIPKPTTALPALVVELKWNESANSAIKQIKARNYPAVLQDYVGEIILVGINYSENTGKHT
ncbi:MAG: AAA family ATPase, partial [Oscillospiraceae bacterium]